MVVGVSGTLYCHPHVLAHAQNYNGIFTSKLALATMGVAQKMQLRFGQFQDATNL